MSHECFKGYEDCRWRYKKVGCHIVRHHVEYPRSVYKSDLEVEYRELESNRQELCKYDEELLHSNPVPPPKPEPLEMAQRVVSENYGDLSPSDQNRMMGFLLDTHFWQIKAMGLSTELPASGE